MQQPRRIPPRRAGRPWRMVRCGSCGEVLTRSALRWAGCEQRVQGRQTETGVAQLTVEACDAESLTGGYTSWIHSTTSTVAVSTLRCRCLHCRCLHCRCLHCRCLHCCPQALISSSFFHFRISIFLASANSCSSSRPCLRSPVHLHAMRGRETGQAMCEEMCEEAGWLSAPSAPITSAYKYTPPFHTRSPLTLTPHLPHTCPTPHTLHPTHPTRTSHAQQPREQGGPNGRKFGNRAFLAVASY
jgi:hypothetical protein